MRQEVYVKFAEALQAKKALARAAHVREKFAEALQARQLQKQAQIAAVSKMIAPPAGKLARMLLKLRLKASPKIDTSRWSKFDPRRLFVASRPVTFTARNSNMISALARRIGDAATGGGAYAYGGAGGGDAGPIRAFSDLSSIAGVGKTTRLAPSRVLAALGLAGGASAALSGDDSAPASSPSVPAATTGAAGRDLLSRAYNNPRLRSAIARIGGAGSAVADKGRDLMSRILANHDLHVGLAGAGVGLAAGGTGGALLAGSSKAPVKKRKRKAEDEAVV